MLVLIVGLIVLSNGLFVTGVLIEHNGGGLIHQNDRYVMSDELMTRTS